MKKDEYIVMPTEFTELSGSSLSVNFNSAVKAGLERILPLVTEIVARDGGEIVYDGSNFGNPGAPHEYATFMLVKVSEAAAREITKLDKVSIGINYQIGPL